MYENWARRPHPMPGIMGLRIHLIPTEKQRTRAMSLKETLSAYWLHIQEELLPCRRIALRICLPVTKMLARFDSDRFYPLGCQTNSGGHVGSVRCVLRRPG